MKTLTESVEEERDAQRQEDSVLKERQHGGQTPEERKLLLHVVVIRKVSCDFFGLII